MPVSQNMNIKRRGFQLILHMIAMEINLTITMIYLQLETRIMHYRNLSKQIFFDSRGESAALVRRMPGPIVFFQKVLKEKSLIFYMKLRKRFR